MLPFAQLQRRIGRKTLGKTILAEVPVVLMAYDLLEDGGEDVRARPLERRRARLAEIVAVDAARRRLDRSRPSVDGRAPGRSSPRPATGSRARQAEGLMLKRLGLALPRRPRSGATGGSGRSSRSPSTPS